MTASPSTQYEDFAGAGDYFFFYFAAYQRITAAQTRYEMEGIPLSSKAGKKWQTESGEFTHTPIALSWKNIKYEVEVVSNLLLLPLCPHLRGVITA